jgi:2-amino-4-hydroxy-6-hydroxymethyldihydropteridine diphosphokinase
LIKELPKKAEIGTVIKQDTLEKQAKIVYLGVGSNLGNKKNNIEKAKSLLIENFINLISISSYYTTPSWPNPKKPKFLNIVIKAKCFLEPFELLNLCKLIERKLGRKKGPKNSPRECDIDIIDFNKVIFKDKLILPHKMMHLRNFVLVPLFEIEKKWTHPITKIQIKKLIFSLPNKDIRSIKQI